MSKQEFSKKVVTLTMLGSWLFIGFACFEMHIQKTLEPIAYIGAGIVGLLSVVVSAYMWRAKQKDLTDLEFEKIKKIAGLRKEMGEYVQEESISRIEE